MGYKMKKDEPARKPLDKWLLKIMVTFTDICFAGKFSMELHRIP